jgi:HEAT repeat protein
MRSATNILVFLSLLMATDMRAAAEDPAAADSRDLAILRQQGALMQGAGPDRESVAKVLRELLPSDKDRERTSALIAQLGSDDYREREAATEALMRMPRPPLRELLEAAKSEDAEVRQRAGRILAEAGESSTSVVVFATCRVIAQQKLTGLTQDLLAAAALADSEPVRAAVRLAMVATAGPEDVPALSKALEAGHGETRHIEAGHIETRIAAIWGLAAAGGPAATSAIEPLLADEREPPALRLAAAEALALYRRPAAASALVDLLGAEDAPIRPKAALLLRAVSGKQLDFAPDGPADQRARQRAEWVEWLQGDGRLVAVPGQPKARWADLFDHYLIYGSHESARTEFVKGVPKLLMGHFPTVTRTANTTGSVTDRHDVARWLYPNPGKGERPHVLVEDDQRLYPIWGSWQQRWQDWIVLNENSTYIQNATAHGGPHWESRLKYVVVPVEK